MRLSSSDIGNAVAKLAPEYGISKAMLFGSMARGDDKEDSDIDLCIELIEPLGFAGGRLHLELEKELDSEVDLVFGADTLIPPVRENVERDWIVVYDVCA